MGKLPEHYKNMQQQYKSVMDSLYQLGQEIHAAGPIDQKQAQLIQLAAAAAQRSEGAVHSHTRRALEAGVSPEEIKHTLILLISTIGYPNVAAALSWAEDIISGK